MVVEGIFNVFFLIVSGLLTMLPEVTWSVDTGAWQYVRDILNMIAYMLPINTITAIIALVVDIALLRIFISFIRTIWNLIPFV